MSHEHYDRLLYLYFYGDLESKELTEIKKHLQLCTDCRKELQELERLRTLLDKYEYVPADERLLQEARNELSKSFYVPETADSPLDRLKEFIINIPAGYKLALGSASLIIIGFLAGYLTTQSTKYEVQNTSLSPENTSHFGEPLSTTPRISNVRFIDSDDGDGEIEFTFDAVMPIHMKGRIEDPNVQKVLANALVSEQNPGIRLQSLNAVRSEPSIFRLDNELLDALISAVRFDKNPGVRKEALRALQSFGSDPKVREALLDVLFRDESAGLRIEAINILSSFKNEYFRNDSSFIKMLKLELNNDKNNYIRMRSRAFLKEIQP